MLLAATEAGAEVVVVSADCESSRLLDAIREALIGRSVVEMVEKDCA